MPAYQIGKALDYWKREGAATLDLWFVEES